MQMGALSAIICVYSYMLIGSFLCSSRGNIIIYEHFCVTNMPVNYYGIHRYVYMLLVVYVRTYMQHLMNACNY